MRSASPRLELSPLRAPGRRAASARAGRDDMGDGRRVRVGRERGRPRPRARDEHGERGRRRRLRQLEPHHALRPAAASRPANTGHSRASSRRLRRGTFEDGALAVARGERDDRPARADARAAVGEGDAELEIASLVGVHPEQPAPPPAGPSRASSAASAPWRSRQRARLAERVERGQRRRPPRSKARRSVVAAAPRARGSGSRAARRARRPPRPRAAAAAARRT